MIRLAILLPLLLAGCSSGSKSEAPQPGQYGSPVAFVTPSDYGGAPNDAVDDTQAIQDAIDSGETVRIDDGLWLVDPVAKLNLPSNTHIVMDPGAVLQASASGASNAFTFWAVDQSNISITGGTIRGVKGGTGLSIGLFVASCSDVRINNVRFQNHQTDGMVVTQSTAGISSQIVVTNCEFSDNARSGVSFVHVDGAQITNSRFHHNGPNSPAAGIDVEPNSGLSAKNVTISDCVSYANHGRGFLIQKGNGAFCKEVTITDSLSFSNGSSGFEFSGVTNGIFSNLNATANGTHGFNFNGQSTDLSFTACHSHGNGSSGMAGSFSNGLALTSCVFNGNAVHGAAVEGDRLRVLGCDLSNNGYYGLWISAGQGVSITATTAVGNTIDQIVNQGTP